MSSAGARSSSPDSIMLIRCTGMPVRSARAVRVASLAMRAASRRLATWLLGVGSPRGSGVIGGEGGLCGLESWAISCLPWTLLRRQRVYFHKWHYAA
jgi:hypothetical protein